MSTERAWTLGTLLVAIKVGLGMRRSRNSVVLIACFLLAVTACGGSSQQSDSQTSHIEEEQTSSSLSNYCDDVLELMNILNEGGTINAYDQLLTELVAESPAAHTDTWTLLLKLSQESFTYENFNPAVDSLESIFPDLESRCPELERMIVNDNGRVTSSV